MSFDGGLVLGGDGMAHERREAGMPPRLELGDENFGDRLPLEKSSEKMFANQDHERIFRIDLDRGTREPWKELDREGGCSGVGVANVVLTPDGNSYAYTFYDDASTLHLAEGLR